MTPRKRLMTAGERGALVDCSLRRETAKGARQQESWPGTKAGKAEAEAFFKAFADEIAAKQERPALTMRTMWNAYLAAEAEHLRVNTRRLYAAAWRTWEQFIGAETLADDLSIQQIARVSPEARRAGLGDGDREGLHSERPHRVQLGRAIGTARAQPLAPVRPQGQQGEADQAAGRVPRGRVPADLEGARPGQARASGGHGSRSGCSASTATARTRS
jgi:hypothetical protein